VFPQEKSTKFITVSLRAASIVSRGGLLLLLAKILPERGFAEFVVLNGVLSFFVIFFGFDLTRWFQRAIASGDLLDGVSAVLVSLWVHLLLGSFGMVVFYFSAPFIVGVGNLLLAMFAVLVAFEMLAQESTRIMIVRNQQLYAAVFMVIRTVIPFVYVFAQLYKGGIVNGVDVAVVLAGSSGIACYGGWRFVLKNEDIIKPVFLGVIRLREALKFSLSFFISTLISKAIFTLDKAFIYAVFGAGVTAEYSLWLATAMVAVPVFDIVISSWALPKLYRFHREGESKKLSEVVLVNFKWLFINSLAVFIGGGVFMYYVYNEYMKYGFSSIFLTYSIVLVYLCFMNLGMFNQVASHVYNQVFSSLSVIVLLLGLLACIYVFNFPFIFYLAAIVLSLFVGLGVRFQKFWLSSSE